MKIRKVALAVTAACAVLACVLNATAQDTTADNTPAQLDAVFVCTGLEAGRPLGRAVVFPGTTGTLLCYSSFTVVAESEQITHRWLYRDREIAQFKLTIQPPRWSSYSRLKLPSDSSGPWRVEVLDQNGEMYGTARFSIVD
jgi:hypothetical protein